MASRQTIAIYTRVGALVAAITLIGAVVAAPLIDHFWSPEAALADGAHQGAQNTMPVQAAFR